MEEKTKKIIVLLVLVVLNLLLGLLAFACGIWMHANPDIYAFLSIFILNAFDKTLVSSAGIMLAVGFFVILFSALGLVCIILIKFRRFFKLYLYLLIPVMILALIGGFMPIGVRYDIFRYVKQGMKDQLENNYLPNTNVAKLWNRVQVKKRCCGIDGSWDYLTSQWFFSANNQNLIDQKVFVPNSCCVLNENQNREISWIDPEVLQPRDRKRCQEDAHGKIGQSANVLSQGCFVALFSKTTDLWQDQSIFSLMDMITGICLTIGLYQIIVLIIGFIFLPTIFDGDNTDKRSLTLRSY